MRFGILGPFEVADDQGRELVLGGHKQRAVLAILLLHVDEVVSSDRLIDELWGERAPATAAKTIQVYVSNLRKALGDNVLLTRAPGYVLQCKPAEVDLVRFRELVAAGQRSLAGGDLRAAVESLREGLGLWRGPPLLDFAYESFAQSEIVRLEEERLAVLEDRIDLELALGQHAALVGELEALVREQPLRERLHGQLMLALYRSGRQAEALEAYQRMHAYLSGELGLHPGAELKALQTAILNHDQSLAGPPRATNGISVRSSPARGTSDVPPAVVQTPADGERRIMRERELQETEGIDRLPGAAHAQLAGLPTGTVTFLFTDIEGSTPLLGELGCERYGAELELHRVRVRRAIAAHGGVEVGTEGDAFFVAFARAFDALGAASELQSALADGAIRVRIGIHTGEPLVVAGNYVGLDVHKAARICAAAHGGQVLVSEVTRDLAGEGLRDLGEYRLKDLTAPERLFQLGAGEFPPLRTLRPTNLPVQPGPLLGRGDELAELLLLARASRLVTLTGPGGSGKTRLALALAAELSDEYQDGVWWVPLSAITDPGLVLPTIAQTLGARDELRERLADKRVLVLLDNLEQVLDCAPLISDLLGGLRDLSVIATSRERLAISFEQEYPVPPLDAAAAEELFVSRARQVEPGFEPDATVGEICRRLDRLPLALELASTRVKLMTTAQMLDRLERRLELLTKGRRDAPDRQATMRATIGWSYDLLPKQEQALFCQLGVFAGSFELEAAQAICDADLDGVQSLIEKSLLQRNGHGRFFLLELTREYALEQLHGAGEEAPLRRRHADWFLKLARRANEYLRSAEQGRWLSRLELDRDNLRAALAWCSRHDPAGAIELATTLFLPWRMHGQHHELIPWLETALTTRVAVDTRSRAVGLRTLGEALSFLEQPDRAQQPLEESLALFRELNDEYGEASVLILIGMLVADQGSPQAIELYEAGLAIARKTGDKPTIARALQMLAFSLLSRGELERSRSTFEESLAIETELGDHSFVAYNLTGLGDVALARKDPELVERHYRDALDEVSGLGDERIEMYSVAALACVDALRGDVYSAGRLWAVAEAAEARLGMRMIANERARYERILTALQHEQAFHAGYQAGRDIELADAVRELRAS